MKIRFNLLPEDQKKFLQVQKNLRTVMEQEIYILIVCSILVVSFFAMYFLLKTEATIMKQVESDIITQNGYEEVLNIHKQFKDVHTKLNNISALGQKNVVWSKFFSILSEHIGENVIIKKLEVSDQHVTINAVANAREDVVALKDQINSIEIDGQKCFDNVSVPESNLAVPVNVSFSIGFDVNLLCLQ